MNNVNLSIGARNVVTPMGVQDARIVVRDGRIAAIEPRSGGAASASGSVPSVPRSAASERLDVASARSTDFDFGDAWLLPGLVDTHVHVNEPGRTEWEGFATATRAAAAGGITTLVDMPLNSVPATTTFDALKSKMEAARGQLHVDVGLWGGVVPGNAHELESLASAGVLGFKCFMSPSGVDEFPHVSEPDLAAAMPIIAATGLPLLVHAESPRALAAATVASAGGNARRYATWLASRPPEAEIEAIRMLIRLCEQTGCRLHIVHLAAATALNDLRAARSRGLPITVETCPHYLCFAAEEIADGATEFKCAPPIRESANRDALWAALEAGEIDLVASDHSPCPPAMKATESGDFIKAWGGIASLEVALSAMWTRLHARGGRLEQLAEWMAAAPARLAGLDRKKGRIAPGYDADLVVFEPNASWMVDSARLRQRHPLTPYAGERLRGQVVVAFVRGRQVHGGSETVSPGGRLLKR